jgi:hypothetical protein
MKLKTVMLPLILTMQIAGSDLFAQPGKQVINEDGWTVPGVAEIDSMRSSNKLTRNIEGKSIQVSRYSQTKRQIIKFPVIDESNGIIKYGEIEIEVLWINQFDINGKPFCYKVSVGLIRNGMGILAAYTYAYYDEDGTGKFKTREGPLGPMKPGIQEIRLPDWVKNIDQPR